MRQSSRPPDVEEHANRAKRRSRHLRPRRHIARRPQNATRPSSFGGYDTRLAQVFPAQSSRSRPSVWFPSTALLVSAASPYHLEVSRKRRGHTGLQRSAHVGDARHLSRRPPRIKSGHVHCADINIFLCHLRKRDLAPPKPLPVQDRHRLQAANDYESCSAICCDTGSRTLESWVQANRAEAEHGARVIARRN